MLRTPFGHRLIATTSANGVAVPINEFSGVTTDFGSTANVADLTSVSTTMDGQTITEGKTVLLKDQSTGSQNGPYFADSVSGSNCVLKRLPGFETGELMAPGFTFMILNGTVNADERYIAQGTAALTIGTDAITLERAVDLSDAAALGSHPIPLGANFALVAGTVLAAFADNAGASAPGISVTDSKAYGIRWNNQATLTAVWSSFAVPADMDVTKASTMEYVVSKTGATVGDATKMTLSAFSQSNGTLDDAGADFGGDSSALVGNAAAKTSTKLTFAIAANVMVSGGDVSFSIKPKDGTLGTDDAIITGLRLAYTRKLV